MNLLLWLVLISATAFLGQNIANTYAEECARGITLTNTSGVIKSPSYPSPYPDNQNCSWKITASQGNRVKLVIRANSLVIQQCGSQYKCLCDYLQVQNGCSADWNGSEKICGFPNKIITHYSTCDSLKVVFLSDNTSSNQYAGFEASYTQLNYSPPMTATTAASQTVTAETAPSQTVTAATAASQTVIAATPSQTVTATTAASQTVTAATAASQTVTAVTAASQKVTAVLLWVSVVLVVTILIIIAVCCFKGRK